MSISGIECANLSDDCGTWKCHISLSRVDIEQFQDEIGCACCAVLSSDVAEAARVSWTTGRYITQSTRLHFLPTASICFQRWYAPSSTSTNVSGEGWTTGTGTPVYDEVIMDQEGYRWWLWRG